MSVYPDLTLLIKLVTPCMLLSNDYAKRWFVALTQKEFAMFYFLRYLKSSGHFECKVLVYELLAIYKSENPLINEKAYFENLEDDPEFRRFSRWLLLHRPSLVPPKSVAASLDSTAPSERESTRLSASDGPVAKENAEW